MSRNILNRNSFAQIQAAASMGAGFAVGCAHRADLRGEPRLRERYALRSPETKSPGTPKRWTAGDTSASTDDRAQDQRIALAVPVVPARQVAAPAAVWARLVVSRALGN
jgi:hypothetical protein